MNVDKIVNALNKMYAELYSSRKFCENCDACDLKGGEKFDFAVKVGKNYGDKLKVLVIGKESKEKHTNVGTTESFEVQKNQHYRRTYDILNYLINDVPIDNYNGYKHISEKEISTLNAFFALTNHYHCYFGKKAHSRSSSNCMWYHCAGIVKQEIEILNPDVIIIQAGWAAKESTDLNDLEKILPIEKGNLHKAPERRVRHSD